MKLRDLGLALALFAAVGLAVGSGHQAVGAPDQAPGEITGVTQWLNAPSEGEEPAWSKDGKVEFSKLKDKVVVVEFWATWCPPCRETVPHLNELYAELKDQGLVVLALTSIDQRQSKQRASEFVRENIEYPVGLLENSDTLRNYRVRGIPHAVVVGRDGHVVWSGHPLSHEFEEAVRAQLK